MQMVIAPNDLFSWNNRYNKYNVTNIFSHLLPELSTWTYSVHARVLKPWRGSLPWPPAIFSFSVVTSFLFPCLGSTDVPCPRLGDPVPPPPRWRPYSGGPRTLPHRDSEQDKSYSTGDLPFWQDNTARLSFDRLPEWATSPYPRISPKCDLFIGCFVADYQHLMYLKNNLLAIFYVVGGIFPIPH